MSEPRFRPGRARVLRAVAAVLVVAVLAGLVGVRAAGLDRLPDVRSLPSLSTRSDLLVYDRTGTVLLADIAADPGVHHYGVPLKQMGRWLPAATVAVDDPNYWTAPVPALAQRLVRLRHLADYSGTAGGLRQTAQAARVVTAFSRDQVLAMYLDSLFYGNQAYGPEAAARGYFGVGASQLDLAQAALLAGVPQHPALFDPVHNWPAAKERQRQVLDAMARSGEISRRQADQAVREALRLSPAPSAILAPAFVAYALNQLRSQLGSHALDRGGRVVTTLDWGLQQQGEQAVAAALADAGSQNAHAGALVTTDPRTGQALAIVSSGGNPAGVSTVAGPLLLNPGSSFRLFTYVAAIASRRYTMASPIPDGGSIVVQAPGASAGPTYRVPNADYSSHGTCQLPVCLANSLNVPSLEVELGTGLPEIVKMAGAMGAPARVMNEAGLVQNLSPESAGPSLTLGGYGETPVQMAAAVSTIAAGGVFHEIEAVSEARSPAGAVLFRANERRGSRQAIDPGVAFVASQMLADDESRALLVGRGSPLLLPGRRAAALSGTTDNLNDSWALGYTPSLASVVWVGNADLAKVGAALDASAAPATWHRFMAAALDSMHKGDEWYTAPAGLTSSVAGGRQLYFLPGTSASTPVPALPAWAHLAGVPPRPSPIPPTYPPGG